ncbi:hypothetical protein E2C01_021439 [Portunus trituberculatus]|uniref:Uncharacterized protein n=1 Tax=Portunus trituberculatus TaxID=210409 RepID=A0A5B7E2L6_PORTR|nr:hypothetical protein [Portunus trituberculatus]
MAILFECRPLHVAFSGAAACGVHEEISGTEVWSENEKGRWRVERRGAPAWSCKASARPFSTSHGQHPLYFTQHPPALRPAATSHLAGARYTRKTSEEAWLKLRHETVRCNLGVICCLCNYIEAMTHTDSSPRRLIRSATARPKLTLSLTTPGPQCMTCRPACKAGMKEHEPSGGRAGGGWRERCSEIHPGQRHISSVMRLPLTCAFFPHLFICFSHLFALRQCALSPAPFLPLSILVICVRAVVLDLPTRLAYLPQPSLTCNVHLIAPPPPRASGTALFVNNDYEIHVKHQEFITFMTVILADRLI